MTPPPMTTTLARCGRALWESADAVDEAVEEGSPGAAELTRRPYPEPCGDGLPRLLDRAHRRPGAGTHGVLAPHPHLARGIAGEPTVVVVVGRPVGRGRDPR